MKKFVSIGSKELFCQAPMTAESYMIKAIDDINMHLGSGYASKHPELRAAYMQTAAIDYGTAIIAGAIESVGEYIGDVASALGDAAVQSVADALDEIASELKNAGGK